MNRRSILALIGLVPVAAGAPVAAKAKQGVRVSVYGDDPGYLPYPQRAFAKVFLDGVEQRLCTTADETTGEVRRFATDADGDGIFENGEWREEKVFGRVQVVMPPASA